MTIWAIEEDSIFISFFQLGIKFASRGGGFYFGGPAYGGGGLGLVLIIILIIYLMGGLRGRR